MTTRDPRYPEEITIDVNARLHLEHTDVEGKSVEVVDGEVVSRPNEGTYSISLAPKSGRPFAAMTAIPCVILVVLFVLDWPDSANGEESKLRDDRGLPRPENFLDLSDGEYAGSVRLDYDDGFAFKEFEVTREAEDRFTADIETTHRYPSTKSDDLVRLLPHDVVLVDAGPGRVFGSTQVRMLAEDGSIETGDATIEVRFENEHARLCSTEVFSYEYDFGDLEEVPLEIEATGVMRAVDTGPKKPDLDRSDRRSPGRNR